jgi:chromosomal replication initiator protein
MGAGVLQEGRPEAVSSETTNQLAEPWARVRGRLRAEVGDAAFRSWLKPLVLLSLREGVVRLAVPSRFMRDWVSGNYADRLRDLWREEEPKILDVEIVVQPPARPDNRDRMAEELPERPAGANRLASPAPAPSRALATCGAREPRMPARDEDGVQREG